MNGTYNCGLHPHWLKRNTPARKTPSFSLGATKGLNRNSCLRCLGLSVWEKGEKIARIAGVEREVPSYPLDRRPFHPTDPNDLHPYPSLNIIILQTAVTPKLGMRAGGTCKASFGEILKFFNSPPKLSPNWHKLACVTERLNPCSLHRHSISQARQTQHVARSARRGTCRASLKIPRFYVCLAWLINAVIHINEINIHKIPDISSSLFGSRVTSPAAMRAILTWSEPARTPLTSQGGVQQNNVYIYLTVNSAVLLFSSADFLALSLRMNPTVLQFKWTFLAELSFSVFYFRIVQKEIWKCRWIF